MFGKEVMKLAETINERDFVRLCRDILATKGHTGIRIVDGPGDGGRDIHSVCPQGQKYLTQCKFHKDPNSTCRSKDVSELPMAAVKFGYNQGLFVTNARISPQGKREYLNDFGELHLDFLDGEALIEEIMRDNLLKDIWLTDDVGIARARSSAIIYVIVRRHNDDASVLPFVNSMGDSSNLLSVISEMYPSCSFRINTSMVSPEQFEPYRLPEPITSEEGLLPWVKATEVAISGDFPLDTIRSIQESLGKTILSFSYEKWGNVTVKVAAPMINLLDGRNVGARLKVPFKPVSFISTSHSSGDELNWFLPSETSEWTSVCDARVSESDWVRLYHPVLNCCLAYEILGRPSHQERMLRWAMHELRKDAWNNSVFCLKPKWEKWTYDDIDEPDESVAWPWDGRIICGWLDYNLLGLPISARSYERSTTIFDDKKSKEERQTKLSLIKQFLERIPDIELLTAEKARHMVALVGNDPLSTDDSSKFRTADILASPESIPSPLIPNARLFKTTVCWLTDLEGKEDKIKFSEFAVGVVKSYGSYQVQSFTDDRFCGLHITVNSIDLLTKPTEVIIDLLTSDLKLMVNRIEKSFGAGLIRATDKYWEQSYGVRLGVEWFKSPKRYVWGYKASE